jgi:hypothetical protein
MQPETVTPYLENTDSEVSSGVSNSRWTVSPVWFTVPVNFPTVQRWLFNKTSAGF